MPKAAPLTPERRPDPASPRETLRTERDRSFLRMASHELRTPLNSILGFSEILASELYGPLGDPQYKEYAEIIRDSGHKLLNLVNQVLEVIRLSGPPPDFDIRPEGLDAALDDVLAGLAEELAERGVTAVRPDGARLPLVLADPRGLRTVLTNLIHNAVVFSPRGGKVHITAEPVEAMVEIRIRDEGQGVDPADIPRLMAPFEQGENALTRSVEGAGLGLPISVLTCRAMGGALRLTSEPGQGLTATIRLPAA
jgi:signal transduction histidine kinase